MKHKLAYILAVGALLFVGGGCKKSPVPAAEQQQRPAAEAPSDTDKAVDDILKGMTDESTQADKIEENADALNATDPALDAITDGKYDIE